MGIRYPDDMACLRSALALLLTFLCGIVHCNRFNPSWSPYPINRPGGGGLPGSDPSSWSPFPLDNSRPGWDDGSLSPYPYNNEPWRNGQASWQNGDSW